MLPNAAVAAEVVHVLHDHGVHHDHGGPVESMVPVLHGHAHSAGTPEHDHPLTAPGLSSVGTKAREFLQPSLFVTGVAICAARPVVNVSTLGARTAKPLPTPLIPTILRI
jgi:hypothetical protein